MPRLTTDPVCGHPTVSGQGCQQCAVDAVLDGYSCRGRYRDPVIDWPPGAVMFTRGDLGRMRGGTRIFRLPSGPLMYAKPGCDVADIVHVPDWDRGYCVVGDDGRYPTWWSTGGQAKAAAVLRQKLRALPRRGKHWIGYVQRGARYGRIAVTASLLRPFGYGVTNDRRSNSMVAHRASFVAFYGRRPVHGTVDHLCRVKPCANPDCFDDVTQAENQARRRLPPHQHQRKARPPSAYTSGSAPSPVEVPLVGDNLDEALAALQARFGRS